MSRKRAISRSHARRGAVTVEVAIILPLFLLVILAIFELGQAMMYRALLDTVVRETTRLAVSPTVTASELRSSATSRASQLDLGDVEVTVLVDGRPASGSLGNSSALVAVQATATEDRFFLLPNLLTERFLTASDIRRRP